MALELNTAVTIPVITTTTTTPNVSTSVKIPGVAPNSDSLSTSVTTTGISTATFIPGLATYATEPLLTATVPGILNSEPTLGLFTGRLDDVITNSTDYKGVFKTLAEDQLVPDIVALAVSTQKFDNFLVTSASYITTELVKLDSVNISVDFNISSIGKNPADNVQTTVSNYFNISQVLQITANIIEAKASSITKPLPNETVSITAAESIFRKPIKNFYETVTTNSNYKVFNIGLGPENIASVPDSFSRLVNYIRSYANITSILSISAITLSSYKQNNVSVSDIGAIYKVSDFTRNFTDIVLFSDDYYGLATIDDDQYASFNKRVAEQMLVLETTRYYYANKVLCDQFATTDIRSLIYTKPITQSAFSTDISKINLQKYFVGVAGIVTSEYSIFNIKPRIENSTNTVDSLTRLVQYFRSYSTTSVISDLLNRLINYTRSYSDVYTSNERALYKPSLKKLDTITLSENKKYTAGLVKTDSSTLSETKKYTTGLVKRDTATVSTLNLTSARVQKRDLLSLTDLLTYVKTLTAITRLFTDSIHLTDSGTINSQNYFASSYVNPGYAGTNVNFGT